MADVRAHSTESSPLQWCCCYLTNRKRATLTPENLFPQAGNFRIFITSPLSAQSFSKFADYSVYAVAYTNAINQLEMNLWINILNGFRPLSAVRTHRRGHSFSLNLSVNLQEKRLFTCIVMQSDIPVWWITVERRRHIVGLFLNRFS